MHRDAHDTLAFATAPPACHTVLDFYSFSSSSSTSAWSDSADQSPADGNSSANTSDTDSCDGSTCLQSSLPRHTAVAADTGASFSQRRPHYPCETKPVAPELRLNPRRTAASHDARPAHPPVLTRQSERRGDFVDSLIDSATQIVEAIWPFSSPVYCSESVSKTSLPLRTFLQETLRRSRTTYSTLQVALYYLILIKPHVQKQFQATEHQQHQQPAEGAPHRAILCGRRMFLTALILASKYLQDRNYSARAWSKISGLSTQEINQNEVTFLHAVDWKLHIADAVFQRWTDVVLKYTPPSPPPSPGAASIATTRSQAAEWKHIIIGLDPDLTNIRALLPPLLPPQLPESRRSSDLSLQSPRSILNLPVESPLKLPVPSLARCPTVSNTASTSLSTPGLREHATATAFPSCRRNLEPFPPAAPTGAVPPMRRACTPAVSAASQILARAGGGGGAMSMAMTQATYVSNAQTLDRASFSSTSSPQPCFLARRRSSLANSVSTASSPESMVSSSSRSSLSSSASSASFLASAAPCGLRSAHSRFRESRLWGDGVSAKLTVPPMLESLGDWCRLAPSPESQSGPTTRFGDLRLDTPLGKCDVECKKSTAHDDASDAAMVLQQMYNYGSSVESTPTNAKTGSKRSRAPSTVDRSSLGGGTDDMLSGCSAPPAPADRIMKLGRSDHGKSDGDMQTPLPPRLPGMSGKRARYTFNTASARSAPSLLSRSSGGWDSILN